MENRNHNLLSYLKLAFYSQRKISFLVVTIGLVVIVVFLSSCRPEIERTQGKNAQIIKAYLDQHLVNVKFDGHQIEVISDGEIGFYSDEKGWVKTLSLQVGDRFNAAPDHHASRTFRIREIAKNGVLLEYTDHFDHRSFGKDLVTIDEGTVQVSFR